MRHAIKSSIPLLLVIALAAVPALARDGHGRDRDYRDHDRQGYEYRGNGRHSGHARDRDYRAERRYRDDRRDDRYYDQRRGYVVRPVYRPVYVTPAPRWARGVRYDYRGYGPTYVVRDYHGYGLRSPPRGHYWRRSDAGDFLLVAVATGLITDLILHH